MSLCSQSIYFTVHWFEHAIFRVHSSIVGQPLCNGQNDPFQCVRYMVPPITHSIYMYMCVNMHTIKVETLEATSTESL